MMPRARITRSPSALKSAVLWALFALLALNALLYTLQVAAPFVRADLWRHLRFILIPFLEGQQGWTILWSDHHPIPLVHLLQLANLKWLGFRPVLDAYLGLACQAGTAALFLAAIIRPRADGGHAEPLRWLGAAGVLFLLLGLSNPVQYNWPLVTLFQLAFLPGVALLLVIDRLAVCWTPTGAVLASVLAALLYLAHAHFAVIFLITGLLTALLLALRHKNRNCVAIGILMATHLLAWKLVLGLLTKSTSQYPMREMWASVPTLLAELPTVATAYFLGLASGIIHFQPLQSSAPGSEWMLVAAAWTLGLLFFTTIVLLWRRKSNQVPFAALALMIFSLVFAPGYFVFRFDPVNDGIWSFAAAHRYAPAHKLALAGMAWATLLLLPNSSKRRRIPVRLLAALGFAGLLLISAWDLQRSWRSVDHFRKQNESMSLSLELAALPGENNIELPSQVVGHNRNVEGTLAFLKDRNLNVFSPQYEPRQLLDSFREARRAMQRSRNVGTAKLLEYPNGQPAPATGALDRIDLSQSEGELKLTTPEGQSHVLRIEVLNGRSAVRRLIVRSKGKAHGNWPLFEGRQNLYLLLEPDSDYTLSFGPACEISEIEAGSISPAASDR